MCSECGKAFSQNSDLKNHQQPCLPGKAYQCSKRTKVFAGHTDFDRHQVQHHNEYCVCNECGKALSQNSSLQTTNSLM